MKEYILQKDLPDVKAGAKLEYVNSGENKGFYRYEGRASNSYVAASCVENNPDWFTPYPDRLDEIIQKEMFHGFSNGQSSYQLQLAHRDFMDEAIEEISKRVAIRFSNSTLADIVQEIEEVEANTYGIREHKEGLLRAIAIIKKRIK